MWMWMAFRLKQNIGKKRISANISISCLLLPIVQEIGKLSDLSITKLFNLHNHDTNVWGFFCKKFLCCSLLWRGNIVSALYNFITIFFYVYPLRYLGFYFDTLLKRIHKSVNLQYITLGCLDDGTNESSTKSLMFQVLFFSYFL